MPDDSPQEAERPAMPISLRISSYQRLTPGQRERFWSDDDAFTIGRANDNDWIMPDPQRFLSGVHCRVEKKGDDYYLTDLSTNGTFVNGAEERMERHSSVQIHDHDRFRIGDYEFVVELGESTQEVDDEDEEPATEGFTAFDQPAAPAPDPFADDDEVDPFADDEPEPEPEADDPDEREINTPLSQMDQNALDRGVDIDSILDLEDEEEASDSEAPGDSGFESINEPMRSPAPAASDDDGFDIPDDWDEATGMFRAPAEDEADDDGFPDDWDETTGTFAGKTTPDPTPEPEPEPEPEPAPEPEPEPEPESEPEAEPRPAPRAEPKPSPQAEAPPEAARPAPAPSRKKAARPSAEPSGAPAGDAVAAFASGAGLDAERLNVADEAAFFRFLGQVNRAFADGIMRALSGRASVKNEFRLDQTMIRPSENNPLKFSPMVDDAMTRLLRQNDDHAYLQGEEAVNEAFEDINAHQVAVMAGMEAALQGLLKRFHPETLEKKMVSHSVLDNILPGAKKAKYWDIFNLMYSEIANEAEDDFQQLFGTEFTRAYEAQMSRLKNKKGS